jgi:hypothetical protein
MSELISKEKAMKVLMKEAPFKDVARIKDCEKAIDIAISSERERIIQEVEKEYKQSDNLQSARVVLRDLLKRLKVKSK